jgi:DNA-binding NtrC family response regulator
MKERILIVEDQFVEADYLRMMLSKAGYEVCQIARSVERAEEIIASEKPDIILLDIFLQGHLTGIDLAKNLHGRNIPFVYLSANSNEEVLSGAKATQPYGFLVKPFREKDLLITLEIARYRYEHSLESRLQKEAVLRKQLAEIVASTGTLEHRLLSIAKAIQPHVPFDFVCTELTHSNDISFNPICFLRIGFDEYQTIGLKELLLVTKLSLPELTRLQALGQSAKKPVVYNDDDFENVIENPSLKKVFAETFDMRSHLSLPLHLLSDESFNFNFYSRRPDAYQPEHLALIERLHDGLSNSLRDMLANGNQRKAALAIAIADDSKPTIAPGFSGIVGRSHLMLSVFDQISSVAPSDTSVLILGESGTGKERIADSIHKMSPRKNMPFVKVNCAALPPTLVESELFGHEKGAFTGAYDRRIGKFEQADKGTIFLDEIGELPLEFQTKFLRVLQEKEVERIGSRSTTKVDVRIIAATNRNLEKEVAEGRFRLDLYYRLNVFPVELPSLRDRKEDIPALANHFMRYYNQKAGKKITSLSDRALGKMMTYNWPGNIRELEHLIERAVLLAKNTQIEDIPLPSIQINDESRMRTIHENEREHILSVLKKCNGRVWGSSGAAEILNINPSTLKSKMKKLGIHKGYSE